MKNKIVTLHKTRISLLHEGARDDDKASYLRAEITPESRETQDELWDAYQWNDEITLRCPLIDVTGIVSNVKYHAVGKLFTIKISNLIYRIEKATTL